ncbi:hypothetical protein PCS_02537 [Desulfocurvibacter africanus PCS]|uniref:Uncharacterized protein n=1 Tax=Desulfocurvibacter africanus PCS TaxID=1262666 RepID=M5PR50_DESAF|nr:hypothetical protein PCS_02537 [Desulfocurvibacter africanus PCS]
MLTQEQGNACTGLDVPVRIIVRVPSFGQQRLEVV